MNNGEQRSGMREEMRIREKTIVGLTGNIATGKSAVLRLASEHGALTIDADKLVHELQEKDAALQKTIVETFGKQVRLADGRIDRTALGRIVFNDPEALAQLERMIHPHVSRRIATLIQESDASMVMIEAIKLLEGNLWTLCREIWVTDCSYELQLKRLCICRGLDEAAASERIQAQGSAAEKIARADVVIDTNGLMQDTRRQFENAWTRLLEGSETGQPD